MIFKIINFPQRLFVRITLCNYEIYIGGFDKPYLIIVVFILSQPILTGLFAWEISRTKPEIDTTVRIIKITLNFLNTVFFNLDRATITMKTIGIIIITGDKLRATRVFLNKIVQRDRDRPITTMSIQLSKSISLLNFLKISFEVKRITNAANSITSEHIMAPITTKKIF
jgi:hypothetical protein